MLWFCSGTPGELIKIYPLIREVQKRGLDWYFFGTGQSAYHLWSQWEDFGLPSDRKASVMETSSDLHNASQATRWFLKAVMIPGRRLRHRIEEASQRPLNKNDPWILHGDTTSTLVGAEWGRRLGLEVSHVEAGLRSPSLFNPFPEEINRRLVSRIARRHFAQDARAVANLGRKSNVRCTGANTLWDTLRLVLATPPKFQIPKGPYAVANIHRFENLASAHRWQDIQWVLEKSARDLPVYFVQHPTTENKLAGDPSAKKRLEDAGVHLMPRMPFTQFIHLLSGAKYVLSDGGSNQEECHYLGKPCLILRDTTERQEGLNGSCLLTRFDRVKIEDFLSNPEKYNRPALELELSPSAMVVEELARRT